MSRIFKGHVAHARANPFRADDALEIIEDGALLVDDAGLIAARGPFARVRAMAPDAELADYGDSWLLPGFVDGHIHFPQYHATAGYGRTLLDWLKGSILPSETRFADEGYARRTAQSFAKRLLAGGTTTALVYGSQFPGATLALFEEAARAGLRLFTGLTLMDRGDEAPAALLTTPERAYRESADLIARIKDNSRLGYAVTPRFAPSCSPELLDVCRRLMDEFPDCLLQTHINEQTGEVEAALASHPPTDHYLGIYDRHGLLDHRAILAHSIHTRQDELALMAKRGCAVCHCADSNLYLGSGLFPMKTHLDAGVPVLLGTDVGAGCRFSMLGELEQVYRIQQLKGFGLTAASLLYLSSLAGAEALGVADRVGNFAEGKEADLVVVATERDPNLHERLGYAGSAKEKLFALLNLAGPGAVACTVIAGKTAYAGN